MKSLPPAFASVVISLARFATGIKGFVCPAFKKSFAPPQTVINSWAFSVFAARNVLI